MKRNKDKLTIRANKEKARQTNRKIIILILSLTIIQTNNAMSLILQTILKYKKTTVLSVQEVVTYFIY